MFDAHHLHRHGGIDRDAGEFGLLGDDGQGLLACVVRESVRIRVGIGADLQ